MKVTISKSEAAKLLRSPVPGYVVTEADWSVRKAGDVELTLEPAKDIVGGQNTTANVGAAA